METLFRLIPVIFAAAIGGCLGSFLNVVVWRLPAGMSLVRPLSFCPKCRHSIRFYDNIPVFGWLLLRGKCRDCHQPISVRYPLIETVAVLAGALFSGLFFFGFRGVPAGLFTWEGLAESFSELERFRAGETFFTAHSPEQVLLTGLGVSVFWTAVFCVYLGIGLIEWDGKRYTPLIYAVLLFSGFLFLGEAAVLPAAGTILFWIVAIFLKSKCRKAVSLVYFALFTTTLTALIAFL